MLRLTAWCCTFLHLAASATMAAERAPLPGIAELRIEAAGEQPALEGYVWYPTRSDATAFRFGANAVFEGFEALPNAPLEPGRFPLVVLSHELMGNVFNQGWLASDLTSAGMVVAAINHPGTTTQDRRPEERDRLWRRPLDLRRLVDAVLADPRFEAAVTGEPVAAIGHSLGGFTVLALAGAPLDPDRYARYCATHPDRADCTFYSSLDGPDDAEWREGLKSVGGDPRIEAIVSLDLGLTQLFDPAGLAVLELPVFVIGAGRADPLLPLDAESRALAAALPDARYLEPEDIGHFDFLDVCRPGGEALLARLEPGDEIVCRPGNGRSRPELQAMVAAEIRAFLKETLAAPLSR